MQTRRRDRLTCFTCAITELPDDFPARRVKSRQTRLAVLVSFTGRRAAARNSFRFAPGCKLSRDVRGEERKRRADSNVGVTSRTRPLFTGGEELEEKRLPPICSVAVACSQSFPTAELSSHDLLQAPGAADRAAMMSISQKDVKKGSCTFILKIFASTDCSGRFIRDTRVLGNHFFLNYENVSCSLKRKKESSPCT